MIGCTTDGECSSALAFQEDSVVVVLFAGDGITAKASVARGLAADLDGAVARAVDALGAPGPLTVALSESMGVSGAVLVDALDRHLQNTLVVGGTAGDQWRFEGTHQLFGREVLTDSVVLLTFHGDFAVSVGVESGWCPMGRRAKVTRAEGAQLLELDGQPALEVFRATFGSHIAPTPEHPFAVFDGSDRFYLRAPFPHLFENGAIQLAGDIPEGAEVQLTEAGRDQILDGARSAVRSARASFPGEQPTGLLVFSCAARKQVLGSRTAEELDALQADGLDVDVAGFYTYGEIGPLVTGGATRFHNETVVAVLVGR
ncbi:MAG: FIST C-terminal domain-containing protein [Myxococcales bacterium]|nr:FIST C-terminal domain-containing protein [Myxococcales bacterium]MCB9669942.1 FIST C-terminal domain-containing protein [Alphaproteobacteria bacterium]MCB9693184.1 FIST C-terminal domain-containing protein [Alphaproteobacteria bacterium]